MGFGKWLGGGIGWAVGGPIGGLFGFALGAMFDNTVNIVPVKGNGRPDPGTSYRHQTTPDDFLKALLVLSATVMKADGRVMKSELDYVRHYLASQFGEERSADMILVLKEILKQDIPVREVCEQIRFNMEYSSRLALLHFLFNISKADGNVDASEVESIKQIAGYLQISAKDFESIRAMFWKDKSAAYKILEIEANVTDEEVKKAYRKMALKYHPDKIAHLGDDFKQSANEKFLKVQEAYETIKSERKMK